MTTNATLVLALVLMTGCAELETGETEQPQILWNKILTNQILWNALTGTVESMDALVDEPLATATFDPETGNKVLARSIKDENAHVFMAYLVSCALDPDQSVSWGGQTWNGAFGLCPEWADGPADVHCQEIVSACLVARNNKKGKSVSLSLRGSFLDGSAFETSDRVPVKWTDGDGEPIASLQPCGKYSDPENCGWSRERSLLGTCDAGTEVTVECGALAGAELRICSSSEGCDSDDAIADGLCKAQFGRWWATKPAVLTCPTSEIFGVMQRPAGSNYNGALPSAPGFPATELEVYGIREGAFYGNLFDSSRRNPLHTRTVGSTGRIEEKITTGADGAIYLDAWACSAPGWSDEDALFRERLCALVETADPTDDSEAELCVATPLGRCHEDMLAGRCTTADAAPTAGDGDYGGCRDKGDVTRPHAVTVFLAEPCALVPVGPACRRSVQR